MSPFIGFRAPNSGSSVDSGVCARKVAPTQGAPALGRQNNRRTLGLDPSNVDSSTLLPLASSASPGPCFDTLSEAPLSDNPTDPFEVAELHKLLALRATNMSEMPWRGAASLAQLIEGAQRNTNKSTQI